jgi:hypothetical protein
VSEQLDHRLWTTPWNRRELPAQRTPPQLIMAELAHSSDANGPGRPMTTENASLTIGNWPDSTSWMPLVMHNQGRLKIRCATLNRMQRVALLM